jgi:hypothetical protein
MKQKIEKIISLRKLSESLDEERKRVNRILEDLYQEVEDEIGITESVKIEGIGTVRATAKRMVSFSDEDTTVQWLLDNGYQDCIVERVEKTALAGVLNEYAERGEDLPVESNIRVYLKPTLTIRQTKTQ